MKLNKWIYGVMALAMLASCSDKDISGSGGENNGNEAGEIASGYIAVQINLPQETGTRADDGVNHEGINDAYKDGVGYEYQIDDALIILFKASSAEGATEKDATYYGAREMSQTFFTNGPADDNITSSWLVAIPVEKEPEQNIYAMAVLNRNKDTFKLETDGNLTIAGSSVKKDETTLETMLEIQTTNNFITETKTGGKYAFSHFFMTNAPLSTAIGGSGATETALNANPAPIQYLTNLGKKVYSSETEAKQNVSGCVYVERAVAKVTYLNNAFDQSAIKFKPKASEITTGMSEYEKSGFTVMSVDGNGNNVKITATISANVSYALSHTNKKSYVVRNVEIGDHFNWGLNCKNAHNVTEYRMVGTQAMPKLSTPFHTDEPEPNLYRTYWCKDPNYATAMGGDDRNVLTNDDDFRSLSVPMYCKENTFTVANQNYGSSTLAMFKAEYTIEYDEVQGETTTHKSTANNPLYTKDGDNSTIYVTDKAAMADAINRIIKDTDIEKAMNACVKIGHPTTGSYSIKDHIKITISTKETTNDSGKTTKELVIDDFEFQLVSNDQWFDSDGIAKLNSMIGNKAGTATSSYNMDGSTAAEGYIPTVKKDLLTNVNALNKVVAYDRGICYYVIPIKHFGDHYTPWSIAADKSATTTLDAYNNGSAWSGSDTHASLYLGRYGMVRNNWYELNISDVRALGSATIPDIDDTLSDDNKTVNKYFAIEIHVLSWAKRTQNVKF